VDFDIGDHHFQRFRGRGVAGNTAFLDFPNEAKCRAAAGAMEASERVAISARPGQTNISPPAYYRIIARCFER
jgi:hypothetical protein